MEFSKWQQYNCSEQIAPVVFEWWRSGMTDSLRFFSTKQGLEHQTEHLIFLGFRKPLLQTKKTFVINTLLTQKTAYIKFSQIAIILCKKTSDGERYWDGSERVQGFSIDNMIQGNLPIPAGDLAIQIDISSFFQNIEPFLMTLD